MLFRSLSVRYSPVVTRKQQCRKMRRQVIIPIFSYRIGGFCHSLPPPSFVLQPIFVAYIIEKQFFPVNRRIPETTPVFTGKPKKTAARSAMLCRATVFLLISELFSQKAELLQFGCIAIVESFQSFICNFLESCIQIFLS